MATIKSYTDIEQSRKLAEILPLDSADMIWVLANPDLPMIRAIAYEDSEKSKYYEILPAWSLAALLDVIPKKINFGYENYSTFDLKPLENGKYLADYYDVSFVKDNPVDTCYEMILKLHELNLL